MLCCTKKWALSALLLLCQGAVTISQIQTPVHYDFIIVGGGTAGCLLAARLSEVPEWTVLLLEAGDEANFLHDIPILGPFHMFTPANWGFTSQTNKTFGFGAKDGRLPWAQGKVLGGSSSINGMVYTRGNRKDYDHWKELGNEGWGYDEVLPYFLKYEKMTIPEFVNDTKYHSTKGELVISHPPFHSPLATTFIEAGVEIGYKENDCNGQNVTGFSYFQSTMKNGTRVSSYRTFLKPVRHRKNLFVMTRSMVTKILIDPDNRKAYGVEYRSSGLIPLQAHAKKEVIISAGAINSPKLLMLSGIGPKDHLQELGIPVLQDSKVGTNLREQVMLLNIYFTVNASVDIRFDNLIKVIDTAEIYLSKRQGEFTIPYFSEAVAFIDVGENNDYPDIEILMGGLLHPAIPLFQYFGLYSDSLVKAFRPLQSRHGFTVEMILLRPLSVGTLKLKDKNPFSAPLLYPNFFSDPSDMKTLIEGMKFVIKLIKSKKFQRFGAEMYLLPFCDEHEFGSDSYWDCYIRYLSNCALHTTSTCKMGPDSDPDAVVDSNLRLRGIKNLRIVDASVMPTITSGNTMAPVYMIAEKAADIIKEYWKKNN